MAIFSPTERRFAEAVGRVMCANPFLPERIAAERDALGAEFVEEQAEWNLSPGESKHANIERLVQRSGRVIQSVHRRAARRAQWVADEESLLVDLGLFLVFHRHRATLDRLIAGAAGEQTARAVRAAYRTMHQEVRPWLTIGGRTVSIAAELPHAFACFYQVRRAYKNIFDFIIGVSRPSAQLRAAVWQSIFTHDMRRYRRSLYRRLGDFTTLISGPSGTGKELVARAIGLSRFVPFDPRTESFVDHRAGVFFSLSLSALSPLLIESELFGHRKGAYTGAIADRAGWLEACPEQGTVFLDEIGEVEPAIQVKLLRVLQNREFSRLGETQLRRFPGKLIAATNRNLPDEMQAGRFREDLYYRLCADVVRLPPLAERIQDNPAELAHLIEHIVIRVLGEPSPELVTETLAVIDRRLGTGYHWPGNVRELEQCVRNVAVRRDYQPAPAAKESTLPEPAAKDVALDPRQVIASAFANGQGTADEILRRYCTLVYAQTGSYEATAARVKLDRRTVKAKIDAELLAALKRG